MPTVIIPERKENYITAEIETLNTFDIEHVLLIYPDGRRVISVDNTDHKAVKWAIDYLEASEFTIQSHERINGQLLITF